MALTPEDFHARAMREADADGRLPLARMTAWQVFPFEPAGLQVVPLAPPELPEPPRYGHGGVDCLACEPQRPPVWSDEHWRLDVLAPAGAPLLLMLQPHEHYDLPDLPDERASELGRLLVQLARAVEGLPHIARAHISRWGDGGEHFHVFVYARPAGFQQLRGTCFAIWDDLLPPSDAEQRAADAASVAAALVTSYGGSAEVAADPST